MNRKKIEIKFWKNIPTKFRESPSKFSAVHPKIALWRNISTSHSRNLAGMFLHISVHNNPLTLVGTCESVVEVYDSGSGIDYRIGFWAFFEFSDFDSNSIPQLS